MSAIPLGFEALPFPENLNCCVCLEPMLKAVTLDPCKHKVCQDCAAPLRACPTCRATITGSAFDHTFSSIVEDAYHRVRCTGCLQDVLGPDAARHRCRVAELLRRFADEAGGLSDATARALIARELTNLEGTPAQQEERVRACLAREAAHLEAQLRSRAAAVAGSTGPGPDQQPPATATSAGSVTGPEREGSPVSEEARAIVAELHHGTVAKVALDKNGKLYGYIEDSMSKVFYYFHSSAVAEGLQPAPGRPVSFRPTATPHSPTGVTATHVNEDSVRRGVVKAWKAAKQVGYLAEPGEQDAFFHANEWKGLGGAPEVGTAVEFIASPNPGHPDTRYAKRVTPLGPTTATASPGSTLPRPPQPARAAPPPGPHTLAAAPADDQLHHGTVTKVAIDKRGKAYGYIEDGASKASHYFHSKNVVDGPPAEPGLPVSFRLAPDPKSPTGVVAVHVTVSQAQGLPRRGTIKAWKPAKQLGFIEEPGEIDAFFHANEWKGPTDPEKGVAVEFVAAHNPKHPGQRYARLVTPLNPAGASSSRLAPRPPQVARPGPASAAAPRPPPPLPATPLAAPPGPGPAAPPAAAACPPPRPPAMPAASPRQRGTVLSYAAELGLGLLRPMDGGLAVPFKFAHVKSDQPPAPGMEVWYDTVPNPGAEGGVHATNVEPLPSLEGLAAEYMARYSSVVLLPAAALRALIQSVLSEPGLDRNEQIFHIEMAIAQAESTWRQ